MRLEAVSQYLRHLKPKGVIAFHVSNRFLDLKPVLVEIARVHGLELTFMHETGEDGGTTSDWVVLTRDKEFLAKPSIREISEPMEPKPGLGPWTDDFSNLVQVLRW